MRPPPRSVGQDRCTLALEVRSVAGHNGRIQTTSDGRDEGVAEAKLASRLMALESGRAGRPRRGRIGRDEVERIEHA